MWFLWWYHNVVVLNVASNGPWVVALASGRSRGIVLWCLLCGGPAWLLVFRTDSICSVGHSRSRSKVKRLWYVLVYVCIITSWKLYTVNYALYNFSLEIQNILVHNSSFKKLHLLEKDTFYDHFEHFGLVCISYLRYMGVKVLYSSFANRILLFQAITVKS